MSKKSKIEATMFDATVAVAGTTTVDPGAVEAALATTEATAFETEVPAIAEPDAPAPPTVVSTGETTGPTKKRAGRKAKTDAVPTPATEPAPTDPNAVATPADAPKPETKRGPRKAKADPIPAPQPAGADTAPPAPGGTLTMAALAERYIASLRDAGKGLGTQFSYSIDIAVAVKHFGPDAEVANLTARKVENYFESDAVTKTRTGRPKVRPGIDKTRRVLRLALVWAAEQGLIATAPIPESALPKRKQAAE